MTLRARAPQPRPFLSLSHHSVRHRRSVSVSLVSTTLGRDDHARRQGRQGPPRSPRGRVYENGGHGGRPQPHQRSHVGVCGGESGEAVRHVFGERWGAGRGGGGVSPPRPCVKSRRADRVARHPAQAPGAQVRARAWGRAPAGRRKVWASANGSTAAVEPCAGRVWCARVFFAVVLASLTHSQTLLVLITNVVFLLSNNQYRRHRFMQNAVTGQGQRSSRERAGGGTRGAGLGGPSPHSLYLS